MSKRFNRLHRLTVWKKDKPDRKLVLNFLSADDKFDTWLEIKREFETDYGSGDFPTVIQRDPKEAAASVRDFFS